MTTIDHALHYLRQAEYIAARDGLSARDAMRRIGASVKVPCRAIGVAKRAIVTHGDIDTAIDALGQLRTVEQKS